jgi:hypothetical protein
MDKVVTKEIRKDKWAKKVIDLKTIANRVVIIIALKCIRT